jgi:hypothetical protein
MIIHRNMGFSLVLLFTSVAFVMMIFVLIIVVGATAYVQAISNTTPATTIPHVTIAFVGNTSPIAGIDHVSVAGIATYNAASSSKNTEQKIITVYWGDGTSSQAKITKISSSSDGRWGPLYHKYDSISTSNHYAIVAAASDVLSSSSSNKGIVQIRSEPYLINVQKGPITGHTSDSLRNNIGFVPKNNGLLFNPVQLSNIIALSIVGSVTVFSLCMVRHMRRSSQKKMIPTINAHRDEKQNHYTNTRSFRKSS